MLSNASIMWTARKYAAAASTSRAPAQLAELTRTFPIVRDFIQPGASGTLRDAHTWLCTMTIARPPHPQDRRNNKSTFTDWSPHVLSNVTAEGIACKHMLRHHCCAPGYRFSRHMPVYMHKHKGLACVSRAWSNHQPTAPRECRLDAGHSVPCSHLGEI